MANDSKEMIKKKKLDVLVADSLDNQATVGKIVEYLEAKSKTGKIYKYYCSNLRQTRRVLNFHHLTPGHTLNCFGDDWDGGLKSGYFENISHKSMKPKMISEIRNIDRKDPVTESMVKKIEWNFKWRPYKRANTNVSSKESFKWHGDDLLECPKVYVEMAEHWERNPDKFFDCNYNWYYAGNGNMQLKTFNGQDYLIHSEFNCLYIAPFSKSDLTIDYSRELIYKCEENMLILETVTSQNLIAIRTKHKITILKLVQNDSVNIEKLKDMESELPFTSITFDEYHKNILYVTSLDYNLTIVNVDRMAGRSKRLRGRIKTLVNNWSTVISSERSYYTHVSKDSIVLYDKRTNSAFQRWKDIEKVADEFLCNEITTAKHCSGKPLLYFGTEHHLFLMDMRYSVNKTLVPVQRWTHGMQCPPTYMKMCVLGNKEFVVLSSQWCEDMCVTSNQTDILTREGDIGSVCIPYRPPSVFSTLREAHQKSMFVELEDHINNRLSTAMTGLVVSQEGDNFYILMQNSLGDISSHALFLEHKMMFIDDDSVEQLYEWSQRHKVDAKEFEVTEVVNIQKLWRNLKRIPEDYRFEESKHLLGSKFNEQDIYDDFENEELESGLIDIWIKEAEQDVSVEGYSQFLE